MAFICARCCVAGDRGRGEKTLECGKGARRTPRGKGLLKIWWTEDCIAARIGVIDGSKALRAGVETCFREQVEVQRCQIHKRRNVKEYLPENCRKITIADAKCLRDDNYAEAKRLAENLPQLERINPSAAEPVGGLKKR